MKRYILLSFIVTILVVPSFAVVGQVDRTEEILEIEERYDGTGNETSFLTPKDFHPVNSLEDASITEGSDFEVETFGYEGKATVFTSPDSAMYSMDRFLDDVDSSLDVAIYLFNHPRIARRIANISRNGISVRVLIEGHPVNGISKGSLSCLGLIDDAGGEVRMMGGEEDPYNYFHPKYIVRDNSSVMLTSENFVPPGFSEDETHGNRGWGIILGSQDIASYYLDVYEHDWELGEDFKGDETEIDELESTSSSESSSMISYSPRFNRTEISGEFKITPILSPDTSMSEKTILDMIRSAEDRIYVQQYYIRDWEDRKNPYVEAIKDAGERGVKVKMMLDTTWYHLGENGNDQMVEEINDFADDMNVDIEARLLSPYKNLLKSHNKAMVIDGYRTLISSINWNANSVLRNREAGMIVENNEVGEYYSCIFLEDWVDTIEPIADAGRDRTVGLDEKVILSGENSWDDHSIRVYRWDTNENGLYDKAGEEITLTFEEQGTYRIELMVEDVGGNIDTDMVTVEVEKEAHSFLDEYINWIILLSPTLVITGLLVKSFFLNRS